MTSPSPRKPGPWTTDYGETCSPSPLSGALPFGKGRQHYEQCSPSCGCSGGWMGASQTISYFGSGDYMTPFFLRVRCGKQQLQFLYPGRDPWYQWQPASGPSAARAGGSIRRFYHKDPNTGLFVYDHVGAFKVPGCPDTDPLCLKHRQCWLRGASAMRDSTP